MAMNQGLTLGFQGTETPGFGLSTCLTAGAAAAGDAAAGGKSDKRALLLVLLLFFWYCPCFSGVAPANRGRESYWQLIEIGLLLHRFA